MTTLFEPAIFLTTRFRQAVGLAGRTIVTGPAVVSAKIIESASVTRYVPAVTVVTRQPAQLSPAGPAGPGGPWDGGAAGPPPPGPGAAQKPRFQVAPLMTQFLRRTT